MSRLRITKTNPFSLLQDAGRFGSRHLGITQGGAADWLSMGWANWLLGNRADATIVEIAFGNFDLIAEADCYLALAGADLQAQIKGRQILPWNSFLLKRGETLSFNSPKNGVRAYLATPGGFCAKPMLGSCATVLRDEMGGLNGDGLALAPGDVLEGIEKTPRIFERSVPYIPDISLRKPLDLVLGAQIGSFTGQSLFDAFNSEWIIDVRADRMGVRLTGPSLAYQGEGLVSEAIPLGAVQVPPDGQPIVLGNDRQTIGGYPRLGALTPISMARLAQASPGDKVRVRPVLAEIAAASHRDTFQQWQ